MKKLNKKKVKLFLKRNKKKIGISTIVILLLLTIFFLMPLKNGRSIFGNIIYNRNIKYAYNQEAYDKLKIADVHLTKTITGTAPFNTDTHESVDDGSVTSNMNGIDVSEKDNYVRTYDTFRYNIELSIAKNSDNPEVTENEDYYGGVIKVKITIPKDKDGKQYYYIVPQAWIGIHSYSESNTYTAVYQMARDKVSNGAIQEFYIDFVANGYAKELDESLMPKIEFWMEGNKEDNSTSSVLSKELNLKNNLLKITGKENYKIELTDGEVNYQSKLNGVKGNYVNFGLQYAMVQPYDYIDDFRGVSLPYGDISSKIGFTYSYKESGSKDWVKITDSSQKGKETLDGVKLIAFGLPDEITPNFKPGEKYNKLSNWRDGIYCGGINSYDVCYNAGDLVSTMNNRIISSTNSNWYYRGEPPATKGTFIYNGLELFIPYYDYENSSNYSYEFVINGISLTYNNYKNELKTIDSDTKYTINMKRSRETGMRLGFHGSNDSEDITSITIGNSKFFRSTIAPYGGAYMGGISELFTWNSTYLEYPIDKDCRYSNTDSDVVETLVIKYGVYKNDKSKGITSDEIVDSAVYDDFDWYDDKADAINHGTISAVYYHDPKSYGFEKQNDFYFPLSAKNDINNLSSVTMIKRKIKACFDEERTDCITHGFDKSYKKATFEDNQFTSPYGDPTNLGQTIYIGKFDTDISISTYDTFVDSKPWKTKFNVQEDYVGIKVVPSILNIIDKLKSDRTDFTLKIIIPQYINYVDGSSNVEPTNISTNTDGETILEYEFKEWTLNDKLPTIYLKGIISQELTNNATRTIISELTASDGFMKTTNIGYNNKSYTMRGSYDEITISLVSLAGQSSRKKVSNDFTNVNSSFEVENYIYNVSQKTLENVKSIEILPKNNDSVGSKFHGDYTIKIDSLFNNQKLYYTTKSINNLDLGEDNTGLTTINKIDSNWQEIGVGDVIPSNATAIASSIGTLSPNDVVSFKYTIIPNGNKAKDKYIFKMNTSSSNLINSITTGNKEISVINKGIKGTVFIDKDRDNKLTDNDELLKNREIKLLDSNKNVISTTTTNENGNYSFEGLNKGNYYIDFGEIPSGYRVIDSEDSVVNDNGLSNLITDLNDDTNKDELIIENISAGFTKKEATLTVKHLITGTNTPLGGEQTSTVYYTDEYSTTSLDPIPTNYKLDSITGVANGIVNSDNIEVIYYYSLKPSNIKVNYIDEDGNNIDESKNIDEIKYWGEEYSYEQLEFPYYDFVKVDGDKISDTISEDSITINFIYKLKKSKITIKYVDESLKDIDSSKNIIDEVYNYGDNYTSSKLTFKNYQFLRVEGDPTEGIVEKDTITINYIYKLKESNYNVKYLDENDNNIDESKNISEVKHWGEEYSTEQLEFANYDFVKVEGEPSGIISSDDTTIIYRYKLKTSVVTINYIDEDNNNLLSPIVIPSYYGKDYSSSIKDIPNYDYVKQTGDNPNGTISKDSITINYIYKLKVGKVITHHYLYDGRETNTKLADDVEKEYKYTKEYTTTKSDKVTKNYELYSKSSNYSGIMNNNIIEVFYYYQLKDSTLSTSIEKEATEEITNKTDAVSYRINYSANVKEYIGDSIITITEQLPYPIDEDKSDLDGGVYDKDNNTITWKVEWNNINSYESDDNTATKTIKKEVSLVYDGIKGRDRSMTSTTNAEIELSNNSRDVEALANTDIKIPGKVIVSYIDEETGKEIEKELEESDLVGESIITTPIEKEGWELIEVPTTNELEFEEEVQTIQYLYRRIKFEIITKALNAGGTIEGDEIVPYGESSTEGKLIITSKEGYVIDKIFIDGEELSTKSNLDKLVLNRFENVKDNHTVEVSFMPQPKVTNPITSHPIISICIILTITAVVIGFLIRKKHITLKKSQ